MKHLKLILLYVGAAVVAATAIAGSKQQGSTVTQLPPELTQALQRACIHPSGGWTIVNCSNAAAASSAELNEWTRYIVQCGDDSYFAPGTAASGQDADSSDGWIPAGAWYEFITTDSIQFYSCLNKNSDSDCRHIECK